MNKLAVKPKPAKVNEPQDVLSKIAKEVETGSREKAHARIKQLRLDGGLSDFELGGWLLRVLEKSKTPDAAAWLKGHDSFKSYCKEECGFSRLKGWHLTKIYQ